MSKNQKITVIGTGYDIEADNLFLEEIRKWHEKPCEMPLKALSYGERKDIIYTYLKQINKSITEPQADSIIKKRKRVILFSCRSYWKN